MARQSQGTAHDKYVHACERADKAEARIAYLEAADVTRVRDISRLAIDRDTAEERNVALVAALDRVEAVMSIVEPRSDKAEYLECLAVVRQALDGHSSIRPNYSEIPNSSVGDVIAAARVLHKLVDELCAAVDATGEDVGGHRGSLTILGEVGPADDALATALGKLDGGDG